jgi:hypothetical protein
MTVTADEPVAQETWALIFGLVSREERSVTPSAVLP